MATKSPLHTISIKYQICEQSWNFKRSIFFTRCLKKLLCYGCGEGGISKWGSIKERLIEIRSGHYLQHLHPLFTTLEGIQPICQIPGVSLGFENVISEEDEDGKFEKRGDSVLPRDLNSVLLQGHVNAWNVRTNTEKMHVEIQKLCQIGTNWNAKTNGDKMQVKIEKR